MSSLEALPAWIASTDHDTHLTKNNVGGKAYHLIAMRQQGLQVPNFGIITDATYQIWKSKNTFNEETIRQVNETIETWSCDYFAVRSSMSLEDGILSSFAGIFESYLFVNKSQLFEHVEKCFQSLENERVQIYLAKNNLDISELKVSVVIQKMIHSKCSGVAFSRTPLGHSGLMLIEAGLGFGEGVVSGHVDVDSYKIDRFGKTWEAQIAHKQTRTRYDALKKKIEIVHIDDEASHQPILNQNQIEEISRLLIFCEGILKAPVDMEWTIDENNHLHFLQTRPITQKFEKLEYYADTNLAESYPNKVLPFTAHFVPRIYEKVLGETLSLMGGRWHSNEQGMNKALKNLIKEVDGHLYYHLNSYYTVLNAYPGGKKNIDAWHRMIGGQKTNIDFDQIDIFKGFQKIAPYFRIIYSILRHDSIYSNFIKNKFKELSEKKQFIELTKTSFESARLPMKFINDTSGWGLTSLNDIIVILGLKILDAMINKYNLPAETITSWLKTENGVDSVDVLKEINTLYNKIMNDGPNDKKEFLKITNEFIEKEATTIRNLWPDLLEKYHKNGWMEKSQQFKEFLDKYGERCFEELKIESLPFSQSISEFFKVFKNHHLEFRFAANASTKTIQDVSLKLNIIDRFILKITLSYTRKAVAARESTRLMRGRFYGLMRHSVLKTSAHFYFENTELCRTQKISRGDFFYLTIDDLYSYSQKQISAQQLIEVIEKRRDQDQLLSQGDIDYPEFYAASCLDEQPYFRKYHQSTAEVHSTEMQGQGVSAGEVTGSVLIVKDPRDALTIETLSDKILVTRSTDPAWIFLMSQCKGLISEKGSLLSHTAIIGRELNIPTIVGVKDATQKLTMGQMVKINGRTGLILLI